MAVVVAVAVAAVAAALLLVAKPGQRKGLRVAAAAVGVCMKGRRALPLTVRVRGE